MRPRDLFGVAVRVMGLWFLTQSAYRAFWAIWKTGGGVGNPRVPVGEDMGECLQSLIVAAALLIFADFIVLGLYGPIQRIMRRNGGHPAPQDASPDA
jgi:hypothetical protein